MSEVNWLYELTKTPDNYAPLVDALEYYEKEYSDAVKELSPNGILIKKASALPGLYTYRMSQYYELEAMVEWINKQYTKVRQSAFKKYLENYGKSLSSRDAGLYADADDKVLAISDLVNQVSLMRNKFIALSKGFETMHFQLTNIVKMKQHGFEDDEINY